MSDSPLERLRETSSTNKLRDVLFDRYPSIRLPLRVPVVVIGAGPEGERLIEILQDQQVTVASVIDNDPRRQGDLICGVRVLGIQGCDQIGDLASGEAIAVVASNRPLASTQQLRQLGAQTVVPFALLQVLYPQLFPPHMFYAEWLETLVQSRDEYAELHDVLGDDLSRATLQSILELRMTMDVEVLHSVVTAKAYMDDELMHLPRGSVCIDCGAFNGDTAEALLGSHSADVARLLAFEPHPATFRDLQAKFTADPRVEPYELAVSSHAGTQSFSDDSSRASLLLPQGTTLVNTQALDNIMKGGRVDYIKMNIEGEELRALEGAKLSIMSWKPLLAIAAYHEPRHLTQIPRLIQTINPDYKLFLRQQDDGFVETVVYAQQPVRL